MTYLIKFFKLLIITLLAIIAIFPLVKIQKKIEISSLFPNKQLLGENKQGVITLVPIKEKRIFEIDLSQNVINFYEDGEKKASFKIAYQSPADVWYQTPTGYFRIGIKKEKHKSSLIPVYFDYAVQFYEDYFIHSLPYYSNGRYLDSQFTGGCLRLEEDQAKKFYELAQPGDLVISYLSLDNLELNPDYRFPVVKNDYWLRQRFNNPLKTRNTYHGLNKIKLNYLQHAGIDLAPKAGAKDLGVYALKEGKIVAIVKNGDNDHGLGNTVIIEHQLANSSSTIYALYAHLSKIENFKLGDYVKKGEKIGEVGATGYGCNYWRINEDGCWQNTPLDLHLHLEIKTKPVLESPIEAQCFINGSYNRCYGYTPENPEKYGYLNPMKILIKEKR